MFLQAFDLTLVFMHNSQLTSTLFKKRVLRMAKALLYIMRWSYKQ